MRLGGEQREMAAILGIAALGGLLRLQSLGNLGLVHFDEGIYALTAAGIAGALSPLAIDPGVIPYAPPGWPTLVGLLNSILGVSDTAAILAAILVGTATIVVAGRLANRAFGPGAGAFAAVFAAFSGMHLAFSRMALTDALYAVAWLVALGAAGRFLARPTLGRSLAFGAAVALAQYVKYNGWLAGVVGALAALPWLLDGRRSTAERLRIVGLGLLAAVVAALLYWPWYAFVERHGGYAGLLAHHRRYVQGIDAWPRNLRQQFDQVTALSGLPDFGPIGRAALRTVALIAAVLLPSWRGPAAGSPFRDRLLAAIAAVAVLLEPNAAWWIALVVIPGSLVAGPERRVLAVGWLVLSVLTPLYHPYARLWLPLLALSWLIAAGAIAGRSRRDGDEPAAARSGRLPIAWGGLVLVAAAATAATSPARPLPGLLSPSDAIRRATGELLTRAEASPGGLLVLARPSVLFYLSGRTELARLADSSSLEGGAGGRPAWAVIDTVQLAQEGDPAARLAAIAASWEEVDRWPLPWNLVTRLDVNPSAASGAAPPRDESLILLRPRRDGVAR